LKYRAILRYCAADGEIETTHVGTLSRFGGLVRVDVDVRDRHGVDVSVQKVHLFNQYIEG
jgi:hypothetical protein